MHFRQKPFLVGAAMLAFLCLFIASLYISAQVEHLAGMAILLVSTAIILVDLRFSAKSQHHQESDQANTPF